LKQDVQDVFSKKRIHMLSHVRVANAGTMSQPSKYLTPCQKAVIDTMNDYESARVCKCTAGGYTLVLNQQRQDHVTNCTIESLIKKGYLTRGIKGRITLK